MLINSGNSTNRGCSPIDIVFPKSSGNNFNGIFPGLKAIVPVCPAIGIIRVIRDSFSEGRLYPGNCGDKPPVDIVFIGGSNKFIRIIGKGGIMLGQEGPKLSDSIV